MATYNPVTPEIIEELKKISGDRVVVGADVNPDYSRDEMPIYGTKMPDVSIDVLSTEEVSAIMKVCYDNNAAPAPAWWAPAPPSPAAWCCAPCA